MRSCLPSQQREKLKSAHLGIAGKRLYWFLPLRLSAEIYSPRKKKKETVYITHKGMTLLEVYH
jgi:hypothetical protein